MLSKENGAPAVTTQATPNRIKLNAEIPIERRLETQAQNPVAVRAAIADLTLDCAVEAATIAAVTARHFVEQIEIDDIVAAKHSLDVALAHLKEAEASFRDWQALKASAREADHG